VIAGIDWEAVGGLGAAVGGVAAAVSAVAAWRAANASHATSRDALEALAVGIRPRLQVGFRQAWEGDSSFHARVVNPSEWAATDLEMEVLLASGERMTAQRARLDAGGDGMGNEEPHWMVKIGELSTESSGAAPAHPHSASVVARVSPDRRRWCFARGAATRTGAEQPEAAAACKGGHAVTPRAG